MKKTHRPTAPSKLVLRREALVVLGVTELGRVAGGSVLDHCSTTHQTTRSPDTGD